MYIDAYKNVRGNKKHPGTLFNLQVRHFDFKFLLKADDDSFVCLARIASMLHDLDPAVTDKVYAGVPTACNQTTNPDYWVRVV